MVKESQMTRNNTRYQPYNSSRRLNRRQELPPPNSSGNQAELHQKQPDTSIDGFLDELYSRYGGTDLAQLFCKYARQSGMLSDAITMWLSFNDVSTLCTSSSWLALQTDARLANC